MTRRTKGEVIPHQVIRDAHGEPEYVVVPYEEFVRLSRGEEDLRDRLMAKEALAEETLPWPLAKRLLHGASPIKVWREHRGISQRQLGRGRWRPGDVSFPAGDPPKATVAGYDDRPRQLGAPVIDA
jgi:hypothetical protein